MDAEALLSKMVAQHGEYVMTQEEATFVWTRYNELIGDNRELQLLALLIDHLTVEGAQGKRCSVCGRYGDSRCIEEC